ncbi:MAG: hypothetical protein VX498_10675 [Myxococcota bacterium]|nr:hypothetical protein [Myxococcota bacterium]
MTRTILPLLALGLLALPATASAGERGQVTSKKLFLQYSLICQSEDAKKLAEQEAQAYAGSDQGVAARNRASAKVEELGRLRSRLRDMVEKYVAEKQLRWHETKDVAKKLKIEDQIRDAQALPDKSCDD